MVRVYRRAVIWAAIFTFLFQTFAFAAESVRLQEMDFHSGREHDRIVLRLDGTASYEVSQSEDGKEIILDLPSVTKKRARNLSASGKRVRGVRFKEKDGHLLVYIRLKSSLKYKVGQLENPARIFLDVLSEPAEPAQKPQKPEPSVSDSKNPKITEVQLEPGLMQTVYEYRDQDGPIVVQMMTADHERFRLQPALGGGQIPGKDTLSSISDYSNAVAAVNASYFSRAGEILGVTKIDGVTVGTTYYKRSAMGVQPDGSIVFGQIEYDGEVTLGNTTLPVSGVDAERGENGLVVYNSWYGNYTGTNEYGLEFVVKGDRVTAVNTGNSRIPSDGYVVSAHGSAKDAFYAIHEGDSAEFAEHLGEPWNDSVHILGVGPRLVEDGKIHVTASEERFGADVAYGRAPRSAVGINKDGDFLFAVVDGRQSFSRGCTLIEWANVLKTLGAVQAMNLDGGGSAELIIRGQIVNSPSDGGERNIGSALLVMPK